MSALQLTARRDHRRDGALRPEDPRRCCGTCTWNLLSREGTTSSQRKKRREREREGEGREGGRGQEEGEVVAAELQAVRKTPKVASDTNRAKTFLERLKLPSRHPKSSYFSL